MDIPKNQALALLALLLTGCATSTQPSATDVKIEFKEQYSLPNRTHVTARWPIRKPKLPPAQLLVVRIPRQSPLLGTYESTGNTVERCGEG